MSPFLQRHLVHAIMIGGPLVILAAMMGWLHLTDPQREPAMRPATPARYVLAGIWIATAGIHLSIIPEHFRENTVLGVFFVCLALVQATYAVLVLARPTRPLLLSGLVTNASVIVLWTYTRTVAIPFGIGPREEVGAVDVACTVLEAISLAVTWYVIFRMRETTRISSGQSRSVVESPRASFG